MMENETVGDLLKRTGMTLDQLIDGFCKNYDGVIWTEEVHEMEGKEKKCTKNLKKSKSNA